MFEFFKRRKLNSQIRDAVLDAEPMHLLGILVYRHAKDADLAPRQRTEAKTQGEAIVAQAEAFRAYQEAPGAQALTPFLPYLAAIAAMKMAADKLPFDAKQCRSNVADMVASLGSAGGFSELYGPVCADASYKIGIFIRTKI